MMHHVIAVLPFDATCSYCRSLSGLGCPYQALNPAGYFLVGQLTRGLLVIRQVAPASLGTPQPKDGVGGYGLNI